MPRCIWTNDTSDRAVPVTLDVPTPTGGTTAPRTLHVLPEHEADLRAYNARVVRYGRPFLAGMLGLCGLLVAAAVAGPAFGWGDRTVAAVVGLGVVGMGALMVALPFATPQTVEALGIRASRRGARALGVLTVALGGTIALFAG